jgi:hypothetical protein
MNAGGVDKACKLNGTNPTEVLIEADENLFELVDWYMEDGQFSSKRGSNI